MSMKRGISVVFVGILGKIVGKKCVRGVDTI